MRKEDDDLKMALEELFDIAHANSLNMMKIKENKEFLLFQEKKGRPTKMGNLDKRFLKKQMS